jgi:hypothetical protein
VIEGLHSHWEPHKGQSRVGKALIAGVKDIFVNAGRNWGKTDFVAYWLWRWAITNPGSENYYFAPYMKQAKEIIWATKRLQNFGPREWITSPNNTELRLPFLNGSFIKCDGSDNVDSYRGIKPKGLIIFDEFKDFKEEFYPSFDPNRAAHDAPLIIIGTPPDRDGQFIDVMLEHQRNPNKRYYWAPSEENPHLSRQWLENKKTELYAKGAGDEWEREYRARFVKGGKKKIFPMLSNGHIKPYKEMLQFLMRDRKKLEWYLWNDPGSATCFATLFVAINPYTKKIYCIDEIYETDQRNMSVGQIGPKMFEIRDELYEDGEWRQGYDEAATWFANEMMDQFEENFEPSHKHLNDKEQGISLIRDVLLSGHLEMSDRCVKLFWEMDNYFKDDSGKIPKKDDHLIDTLRYTLGAAHYKTQEAQEYLESKDEDFRGARIEDDFPQLGGEDDWDLYDQEATV